MAFSILFYIFAVASGIVFFLLKKKKISLDERKLTKIFGACLLAFVLIKVCAADGFLGMVNGGKVYQSDDYVKRHDFFESFVRWTTMVLECLFLSLIVSDNKCVKWLLTYIGLPVLSVAFVRFPWSVQYFLKPIRFIGIYLIPAYLSATLLLLEYITLFVGLLTVALFGEYRLDRSDVVKTVKVGVFALVSCIPFYVFGSVFGTTNIYLEAFNLAHIIWIVCVPLVYIAILLLFRKENEATRFTVLSIMIFYLVIHMTSSFKVGFRSSRFPLQPCNIAGYIALFILLTKNRHLLNYLSIANLTGAIIGILVTDDGYLFNFWMSHYIIEHTYVVLIPLLFIRLGYMPIRPFKEVVKDFFICLTVYFVVCLLVDCIYNGLIYSKYGSTNLNDVNFFFLIECPIDDVLPFYPALETLGVTLFGQKVYLSYLAFLYTAFSLLSFALYFITVGISKLGSLLVKAKKPSQT